MHNDRNRNSKGGNNTTAQHYTSDPNGTKRNVSQTPRVVYRGKTNADNTAQSKAIATKGRQMHARRNVSTGRQNSGLQSAVSRANSAHGANIAPRAVTSVTEKSNEGMLPWLKRTFAVDKTIIEKRDIVREKGSIDYVFLILVIILLAFGTIMVYSASYAYSQNTYGDSYYIIFRQIMFVIAGSIGIALAILFRPEWYKKLSPIVYAFCVLLLCLVPIIGEEHGGAKRWIDVGFTEIQPSEFMKLGLVFMLAWYFDRYYERCVDKKNIISSSFFGVCTPLAITALACVLVVIEKHLSGTIIMFAIGVLVIFASGAPLRLLVGGGAVAGAIFGIVSLVTPYTKRRLDIWLHPELDPQGGGYQTLQGLYAIGSGGLFGEGLGNSYQKHHFVSQPQNDFIFTIVCEELGFIGAIAVIILFVLLVWRGIVIAMKAPDIFSTITVVGIVGKVAIQSILNIAVVTNSIPNTGISLPFFSYGGSSLVVLMVEMGIVLSISRYSKQKR